MDTDRFANEREALVMSLDLIEVTPPENASSTQLENELAAHINYMVEKDFNGLLNLLYRIDVSEEKIKNALLLSTEPAGQLIARLIIDRQLQKIAFRHSFKAGKGF